MNTTETPVRINTVFTADSVEWSLLQFAGQLLALGTYQLEEETRTRLGSLALFSYSDSEPFLTQVAKHKTDPLKDGILDMKWNGDGCLALACSNGTVLFVQLAMKDLLDVKILGAAEVASKAQSLPLCLSLDWSKAEENVIGVSDSSGNLSLVQLTEPGPTVRKQWKAHDFEAWIVALGVDPTLVFSGGDDCKLCVWDTRTDCTKPSLISRRHSMGVCSLQVHPKKSHILASGSYDETLLLWDTRNMSRPQKEAKLGGGIWRIKWNNKRPHLLATACMHNGFQLVNSHLDTSKDPEVVCQYNQHGSLAYGIDWCPLDSAVSDSNNQVTLASCSFYDHSMHIWKTSVK